MKKAHGTRRVVCWTLVALAAWVTVARAQFIRDTRPNLLGGELGGKAILYNIAYERYFSHRVGLGVGFMGVGTSDGAVGLIPVYLAVTPVGNQHSLYLSAGGDIVLGSENWDEVDSEWITVFSAGYLYHSASGFFVRPTMNLFIEGSDFLFLPGVALGGSF